MQKKSYIPKIQPIEFDDYLFGNQKQRTFGLYEKFHIAPIKEYKKYLSLPVPPHRRSVYFFLFVTKGSAVRSKSLNQYEISAGQLFCLPAFQITAIESFSDDIEGFYCHFKPDLFNQKQLKIDIEKDFPLFGLMAEPVVKISNPKKIIKILEILLQEYTSDKINREPIIAHYLTGLLNEVNFEYTELSGEFSNAAVLVTQQYKNLLYQNIHEIKRVADCARLLSMSPNHLNKSVKEVTGKSASEILADMRILEAKVLLKQTYLGISEIAFKIGKFEPSDFTRFFKSKTGITPKAYRQKEN